MNNIGQHIFPKSEDTTVDIVEKENDVTGSLFFVGSHCVCTVCDL